MNRLKNYLMSTLLLPIVLFTGHLDSLAQSQAEWLDRLRARYDSFELLRARFTQRTTSAFGDTMPAQHGMLWMQGDRYRVETDGQTFVTDGATTWVYDALQNQVLINDFVKDEATFSISDFLHHFDRDYEILDTSTTYLNGIRHEVVRLGSKQDDAFFEEVTLTVRASDLLITRLTVIDVNGATMDFLLDEIEIDPPVQEDPFTFTPPADAEIIDLRSS